MIEPTRPLPDAFPLTPAAPEEQLCRAPEELICATPETDFAPELAPQDKTGLESLMGSALKSLSLAATPAAAPAAPAAPPALKLLGLKQGDRLDVDGATTADGSATVKVLNANALELRTSINIPYVVRGLADDEFALAGGKVDLSIKVTREGDKYRYQLLDNNAGGKVKGNGLSQLKISEGSRTESGLWGGSRKIQTQSLSIDTPDGPLTIRLEQDGGEVSGSVSIPGLPGLLNTFDLEKE